VRRGGRIGGVRLEQHRAAMLEVAVRGHAMMEGERRGVGGPEDLGELRRRPRVEAALLALAVGVLRRAERALGRGQVALDVREDAAHGVGPARIPGGAERVEVGVREQRLIVEHLLEVRDAPFAIGGVAMEAAAEHVVQSVRAHRLDVARAPCGARSRRRSSPRAQRCSRNVRLPGEGNSGAPPKPPHASSCSRSRNTAARAAGSAMGCGSALGEPSEPSRPMTCSPAPSTCSRCLRQAYGESRQQLHEARPTRGSWHGGK
jgi:hypothetical protein